MPIELGLNLFKSLKDRLQGKAKPGEKRSSAWRKVRKKHLEKYPKCRVCGLTTKVEVHHILPFNIAPDLELNSDNLTTLCDNKKYGINCHLLIGHHGNYTNVNLTYWEDAISWSIKLGKAVGLKDIKQIGDQTINAAIARLKAEGKL